MSMELDIKDKLSLSDVDLVSPEVVVREFADQLVGITDNMVKGVVEIYSGHIESYRTNFAVALSGFKEHDIQEDLGEIGYENSKYEFYLTAPSLPQYKFRVLFFEYGIGRYPVKVILEQGIAKAIRGSDYTFCAKDKKELEDLINQVLSSSKVVEVIQSLINATILVPTKAVEKELQPSATEDTGPIAAEESQK